MLALDTNVLVYAHRREAREHAVAHALVRELAQGTEPWAIPWPCVYKFFSICLVHGVEKRISRDGDFSLFPELRVENPFKR